MTPDHDKRNSQDSREDFFTGLRHKKLILVTTNIVGLLGIFTGLLVPRVIGFVPSVEWIEMTRWLAFAFGAFTLVGGVWMFHRAARLLGYKKGPLKVFAVVIGAYLSLSCGLNVINVSIPIFAAIVTRQPTELTFEVTQARYLGGRKCRRPIRLDGLPSRFDRLCGFSEDTQDRLHPGSQITVIGIGTWMGIFPERLRIGS